MKFRDNLLYQRQQRNMTQEQLAMLLGVSRQSVAKWEAGQSTPEVDKLMRLAELFNCSLDDLVSGDLTQVAVAPEEVLPENVPTQDVCGYDAHSRSFADRIALGVGIIALGVAMTSLLPAIGSSETLSVIVMLVGVVAGLAFIIPAGIEHAAFAKAHPFVEDFYTEGQKQDVRQRFTRMLVGGIALILAGVIVVIAWESYSASDLGSGLMLVLVAVGAYLIVRGSVYYSLVNVENYNQERAKEQWERDNPRVGQICGIIMLLATIVGLLLLFWGMHLAQSGVDLPFAMEFFWLSWVIGGILCAIVTLAMRGNNVK